MRSRSNGAFDRRQNSCREKSYREEAATAARAAGRAALESMVGNRRGDYCDLYDMVLQLTTAIQAINWVFACCEVSDVSTASSAKLGDVA